MYDLFSVRFTNNTLPVMGAMFETTKRQYAKELDKIQQYYRSRTFWVKNQHLLCRILETGTPPVSYELDKYMLACSARSPYIARNFQMTSEASYGKFHEGVFYGPGSAELFLSIEDYYNYEELAKDWQNIVAVKVLEHPMTDLGMAIPVGQRIGEETGLAVFSVDLPLLYLQYRMFILEQMAEFEKTGTMLGKGHFVMKYVLPNMVPSQLDVAIRNRFMNLHYKLPMGECLKRHPFALSDYTSKVDDALYGVLNRVQDSKSLYQIDMVHIPAVSSKDGYEAAMIPDMVDTAQCQWARYLTRLPLMKFLIDLGGKEGMQANGTTLRQVVKYTRRLLNDGTFLPRIHPEIAFDVNFFMEDISSRVS